MAAVKAHCSVSLVDCGRFTKASWQNHPQPICSTYLKGELYALVPPTECTLSQYEYVRLARAQQNGLGEEDIAVVGQFSVFQIRDVSRVCDPRRKVS